MLITAQNQTLTLTLYSLRLPSGPRRRGRIEVFNTQLLKIST